MRYVNERTNAIYVRGVGMVAPHDEFDFDGEINMSGVVVLPGDGLAAPAKTEKKTEQGTDPE